jgi:hypothetical protein
VFDGALKEARSLRIGLFLSYQIERLTMNGHSLESILDHATKLFSRAVRNRVPRGLSVLLTLAALFFGGSYQSYHYGTRYRIDDQVAG